MPEVTITREDVRKAKAQTHDWKKPGLDQIVNYWLKRFPSAHTYIVQLPNKYIFNTR